MEQNKINLVETKNNVYINTFNNTFNVSGKSLNKLKDDLKKVYYEFENKMVEGIVLVRDQAWKDKEINIFKQNLNKTFLNNYKTIVGKANSNKMDAKKTRDLVALLREYSMFLLTDVEEDPDRLPVKIMSQDLARLLSNQEAVEKATTKVKNLISQGLNESLNLSHIKNDVVDATNQSIGLANYERIKNLELKLKGLISFNEFEANFRMNSNQDVYYNKDNDVSYFLDQGVYLKVNGKYSSLDELLEEQPELEDEIREASFINKVINNTTNRMVYDREKGYYYYSFEDKFYRSRDGFSQENFAFNFNDIEDRLEAVTLINDKHYPNLVQVTENQDLVAEANEIRVYAKSNVLTALNNIKDKALTDELKDNTFRVLKDSLKAYEEATRYEMDNLPWYKRIVGFIVKPYLNHTINSLKNDVKQSLGLTQREFDGLYNAKESNDVLEYESELDKEIEEIKPTGFEIGKYNTTIEGVINNQKLEFSQNVHYAVTQDGFEIDFDKDNELDFPVDLDYERRLNKDNKVEIEIDELNHSDGEINHIDSGMAEKDENTIEERSSKK